jgi:hypothetical protein
VKISNLTNLDVVSSTAKELQSVSLAHQQCRLTTRGLVAFSHLLIVYRGRNYQQGPVVLFFTN